MSLTKEQAVRLAKTGWWNDVGDEDIVGFQLFETKLCMPFDRLHRAVEAVLGRPVWTHEFAFAEQLRVEYLGGCDAPTFEEILGYIPFDKRIVVVNSL